MLSKVIRAGSFDFGQPAVQMVERTMNGNIQKSAAEFAISLKDLKPKKNETLLHVITTGTMDTYGCNSNSDGFNRDHMDYVVPEPEEGGATVIKLEGGLRKHHKSYRKTGQVYKNHKTSEEPSGSIVDETFNEGLGRGELIISVNNDRWHNELENLSKGIAPNLSMGCGVAWDYCSLCGHKRASASDMCDHIRHHKLSMTPEGNQVFLINDKPMFNDISGVVIPADKISFVLRKVASENQPLLSTELAELEGYTAPAIVMDKIAGVRLDKLATLKKLADIEKRILIGGDDVSLLGDAKEDIPGEVKRAVCKDMDKSLPLLKRKKIVLSPEEFLSILLAGRSESSMISEVLPCLAHKLPTLMSDMLQSPDLPELLQDGTYTGLDVNNGYLEGIMDKIVKSHSVDPEIMGHRLTRSALSNRPRTTRIIIVKKAAAFSDNMQKVASYIANEYGKYLIAFSSGQNDFVQRQAVIRKMYT
jgi:hypothetical protein